MRLTNIGILVMTLGAAACGRGDAAAGAAPANPIGTAAKGDAASPATPPAAPVRAASPAVKEITIPAGTTLSIVLDTPVGSDTSRVEERGNAHLARPVVVHGETALAAGSRVAGLVTDARRSGKVKGLAHVAVRFDSVSPSGSDDRYTIQTSAVDRTAASTKKKDAVEIGAPAAGGALIGALVGGKKGAVIGGAVGGGAGTAVVLSTRGKEVHLPKGSALTVKLASPLTVKLRG